MKSLFNHDITLTNGKENDLEQSNDALPAHSVSTGPLLSLPKGKGSNISGSTFYFVLQCKLNKTYRYKRQKASCTQIKHSYNVIAVQTLQFPKKNDI